jgi:hypothetical protein
VTYQYLRERNPAVNQQRGNQNPFCLDEMAAHALRVALPR